jgi:hypothetical protein
MSAPGKHKGVQRTSEVHCVQEKRERRKKWEGHPAVRRERRERRNMPGL